MTTPGSSLGCTPVWTPNRNKVGKPFLPILFWELNNSAPPHLRCRCRNALSIGLPSRRRSPIHHSGSFCLSTWDGQKGKPGVLIWAIQAYSTYPLSSSSVGRSCCLRKTCRYRDIHLGITKTDNTTTTANTLTLSPQHSSNLSQLTRFFLPTNTSPALHRAVLILRSGSRSCDLCLFYTVTARLTFLRTATLGYRLRTASCCAFAGWTA